MSDGLAIETKALTRVYKQRSSKGEKKTIEALAGIDLQVYKGELFGLLGPNGAGKTTLIKILTTLLAPSGGSACVLGLDVVRDFRKIRSLINMVAGGENSGYGMLTVREHLWMFAQFYGLDMRTTRKRTDELLKVVGLSDQANTKSSNLSTGMRQKMNFARGFVSDPRIIFLDEPTLGLDVGAARDVRRYIKEWTAGIGRTTLLTTHYMVEADELCDRVAIIDKGRVLACDKPSALKRQLKQEVVFQLRVAGGDVVEKSASLQTFEGVVKLTSLAQDGFVDLTLFLNQESAIGPVVAALSENGASIQSLNKREPTLEDVFVTLVGRALEESDEDKKE